MQLSGLVLARFGERSAVGPAFSRRRPEAPGSRAWTGDREAKQPQRTDMAETDPKTVQDLTAVVSGLGGDGKADLPVAGEPGVGLGGGVEMRGRSCHGDG